MNALSASRYVIFATTLCSSVLADPYISSGEGSPPVPRNSSRDVDRVSLLLRPSSSRSAGSPSRINGEILKRRVQENEPLKKIQTELGVAQTRLRELQDAGEDTGDIEGEIVRLAEARRRISNEIVKRFVQENERLKKIQADLGVAQKRLRELQQAGEYTGDIQAEIARLEAARRALHRSP